MRLPLDQVPAVGIADWLQGSAPPLAAAAHPSGVLVALARGQVLTVLPLLSPSAADHNTGSPSNGSGFVSSPLHYSKHHFTALAWFAQLKPHKSVSAARCSHAHPEHLQQKQQQQQPWHGHSSAPMEQQDRRWHDTIELAESLLDSEVLLSGTADGQLQIHTATGQLLFKQRLSTSPVLDILVRPHCSGLRCCDASEEVCVAFSNALVRISSLDLRSQVRMLQLVQGGGPHAAATISALPHIRYDLPSSVGPRAAGLSFGPLPADLYSLLSSAAAGSSSFMSGGRSSKHKICIVTVGRNPCMAVFEAEEVPSRSTLAAIVDVASSLTSGVVGAATKVAGFGPSMMYHGVKTLMRPLSGWYVGSPGHQDSSVSAVTFDDPQQLPKPEPLSLLRQLRDDERVLEGLVPAPVGPLLVAPDNLGRVMLLEGASMTVIRMWKGYRDAQCGWLMPPTSHPAHPLGLLLVLFAPKRQTLEVWLPRSGQRLASRCVEYPCLLLQVGLPCGDWGNEQVAGIWQEYFGGATTLALNVETGEVWDVMDCLLEDES